MVRAQQLVYIIYSNSGDWAGACFATVTCTQTPTNSIRSAGSILTANICTTRSTSSSGLDGGKHIRSPPPP